MGAAAWIGNCRWWRKAAEINGEFLARLTMALLMFMLRNMVREYQSFAEFWPHYLREHARPQTRALHYIGTSLAVLIFIASLISGQWMWLWVLPLAGYGFAWVAHFAVERNRPATFTYPLWSLAADFRMWALWFSGRLGPELEKAGVKTQSTD